MLPVVGSGRALGGGETTTVYGPAAAAGGYGAVVAERLFVFIQLEFPWALGPADGRYLLRSREDAEPERVVVLGTLGAARIPIGMLGADSGRRSMLDRLGARRGDRPTSPDPAPVSTTRATVIDPVSLSAEHQARAWLEELDRERETLNATAVVNRVLHYHRIASADPYVHEVSPAQALVIRAGWGEGEQVADGTWLHARELPWRGRARRRGGARRGRGRDRSAVLRPQERLAALLGARNTTLLCEELALRARLDLDQGRLTHAAIQLEDAFVVALPELRSEDRHDLTIRVAELEQLHPQVLEQAQAALPQSPGEPNEDVVEHALGRLEAALRARTAPGVTLG